MRRKETNRRICELPSSETAEGIAETAAYTIAGGVAGWLIGKTIKR